MRNRLPYVLSPAQTAEVGKVEAEHPVRENREEVDIRR
jgi:hypothetical protein